MKIASPFLVQLSISSGVKIVSSASHLSYLCFLPVAAGIGNICKIWPHKSQYTSELHSIHSTFSHRIKITYRKTASTGFRNEFFYLRLQHNRRTYRLIQFLNDKVSFLDAAGAASASNCFKKECVSFPNKMIYFEISTFP